MKTRRTDIRHFHSTTAPSCTPEIMPIILHSFDNSRHHPHHHHHRPPRHHQQHMLGWDEIKVAVVVGGNRWSGVKYACEWVENKAAFRWRSGATLIVRNARTRWKSGQYKPQQQQQQQQRASTTPHQRRHSRSRWSSVTHLWFQGIQRRERSHWQRLLLERLGLPSRTVLVVRMLLQITESLIQIRRLQIHA